MSYHYPGVENISKDFEGPDQAIEMAIEIMEELLARPRWKRPEEGEYYKLRCYLPYGLHVIAKDSVRMLIGRNYKPLGHSGNRYHPEAKYEEYPNLHVSLLPEAFRLISAHNTYKVSTLYCDSTVPWNNRKSAKVYLKRLRTLQTLYW